MLAIHAGIDQGAHDAAGRGASGGADRSRGQPARRHHRAEARDGEQAEARQQPGAAAQRAADAGALGGVGNVIDVGMFGANVLVGDDAHVGGRHTRLLDGVDGGSRLGVTVVDSVTVFMLSPLCWLVTAEPW